MVDVLSAAVTLAKSLQAAVENRPVAVRAAASHKLADEYALLITDEQLRAATADLFRDGHYARAVEEAFKALNGLVREKSGLALDGKPLMERAFSESNPRLRLNNLRTQTERNQQVGYQMITSGAMLGIRNPRAHDHRLVDSAEDALALLAFANHLFLVVASGRRARARAAGPAR